MGKRRIDNYLERDMFDDCRYCHKAPCRCIALAEDPNDAGKYKVFLTNIGSFLTQEFTEIAEAIRVGIEKGFEFGVWKNNTLLASWNPLNGTSYY